MWSIRLKGTHHFLTWKLLEQGAFWEILSYTVLSGFFFLALFCMFVCFRTIPVNAQGLLLALLFQGSCLLELKVPEIKSRLATNKASTYLLSSLSNPLSGVFLCFCFLSTTLQPAMLDPHSQ